MSRYAGKWVMLAATLVLCASCAHSAAVDNQNTAAYPGLPTPADASVAAHTSGPAPADRSCGDPTASLRPSGDTSHGATVDAIRARGYLLVGLDTGSNLFSFRNPLTGVIEGFDVDIAKEIARDVVGDPERLQFRMLGDTVRISALQHRQVDLVTKTMSITCERRRQISFSTQYFLAHQRILTIRPNAGDPLGADVAAIDTVADLAGKKVCTVAATTSLQNVARLAPTATILTVPTWADCLVVLQQRQVDAVSTDDAILAGLAQQDRYLGIVGPNLSNEPYGIGIPQGNDDLVRLVNHTLERIRNDGTWDRIYRKWLSILGPSPGAPPPHYQD